MKRKTQRVCYLCGNVADAPDDHVPPKVFFRGASGHNYQSPNVAVVPSCKLHNGDLSGNDETLARIIADAGARCSSVAMDVNFALFVPVAKRVYSDPEFADQRMALTGTRLLRKPEDYDAEGRPKSPVYDAAQMKRAESGLREKWAIVKSGLQKIAAGIFFHQTGKPLGVEDAGFLKIVVPDFKQIEPSITLTGLEVDENAYFAQHFPAQVTPAWTPVISGNEQVFKCDIAFRNVSNPYRFAMRMQFYQSVRVWITTPWDSHPL